MHFHQRCMLWSWKGRSKNIVSNLFLRKLQSINRLIGQVGRVFAHVRETWVQVQVVSYQRLLKYYSLLNPQRYKVRVKGKMEKSREKSCALPNTSV